VSLRAPRLLAAVWLPLAAWLVLWPAAQARQAAVRELQPVRVAAAGDRGCRMRCAAEVETPAAAGRHCCCAGREEAPERVPPCPDGGASRCLQCFGQGGPLLFAHALSVPEPERNLLGAIRHGDLVAASRDLRPPVPPPRPGGPPLFA
jgi:hypothetical protein